MQILISAFLISSFIPVAGAFSGELKVPETVQIPAGKFLAGSSKAEKEYAYQIDEKAYGHGNTRKWGWYDDEPETYEAQTDAFAIMRFPVTNEQYAAFVKDTGHRTPNVGKAEWIDYGLIHPYKRTRKFAWANDDIPKGRKRHPVVMVSYTDAAAFAEWLSKQTGHTWRLPKALEWEKAMRGTDGRYFPWGNKWDSKNANSHDNGPFDTVPVGKVEGSESPYGVMDAAGQVFEWTSQKRGKDRYYVRGGSWDDSGCGVCRPADRHSRPTHIKHILVGFRLVREVQ